MASPWTTGSKRKLRFAQRVSPVPSRNEIRGEQNSAEGDQAVAHSRLGLLRRMHSGVAVPRIHASVRLGCDPDGLDPPRMQHTRLE
jgi:hypothetical protein